MDLFGQKRIAALEMALELRDGQIKQLREENRRLLCTINPHLKSAFFPEDNLPVISNGSAPLGPEWRCSLQMSDKQVRFCATHSQDLDSQGRCPVTEVTLFRKLQPSKRRVLGSEFCKSRDEQFSSQEN